MANETRFVTSITPVKEVDVTEGGNTYDLSAIDTNALRSFGGKYNSSAYTDNDICRWSNVVVSATSWDGLGDSGWTEASAVSDGTIPQYVYGFAVEFVSALGSTGTVDVSVEASGGATDGYRIFLARLSVGESIAIPIYPEAGEELTPAKVSIRNANYSNGSVEATVNVLLVGA